jgi:hypothetical protein
MSNAIKAVLKHLPAFKPIGTNLDYKDFENILGLFIFFSKLAVRTNNQLISNLTKNTKSKLFSNNILG